MAATISSGSLGTVSVSWVDAGGNPAKVDGPTVWQSSDESLLTVTVAAGNPLIANLYAPGPIGNAQVQATADADLGEGVKSITAVLDMTVIAGQASAGTIDYKQGGQGPPSPGGPPASSTPARHK